MTLLRPEWLLLLPLILWWLWWSGRQGSGASGWQHWFDSGLLAPLLRYHGTGRHWSNRFAGISLLLCPLALAGPALESPDQPGETLLPVYLILAQSPSMLHSDLAPSRHHRARETTERWLAANPGRPVGLIAYSGSAHLIAPATLDHGALGRMLRALSPDIMPVDGRAAQEALQLAIARIVDTGGDILWITDHAGPVIPDALQKIPDTSRLYIVVAGTDSASGPVRRRDGRLVRQTVGQTVPADTGVADLRRAARIAPSGEWQWLDAVERNPGNMLASGRVAGDFSSEPVAGWRDLGPIMFLLLLPGLILQIPRGPQMALIAFIMLSGPASDTMAMGLSWYNPDQQGMRLINETPREAAQRFDNRQWAAYAALFGDQPGKALGLLTDDRSGWGHYHRGLALAQLARYDQALRAFEQALTLRPEWEAARTNRNLLRAFLNQQSDSTPEAGSREQETAAQSQSEAEQPAVPDAETRNTPLSTAAPAERARTNRTDQRLPARGRGFMERKLKIQWEQQQGVR